MAVKSQLILLSLWERSGEGFRSMSEHKETPAPINCKQLRKKFPRSTQTCHIRLSENASFPLFLPINVAI